MGVARRVVIVYNNVTTWVRTHVGVARRVVIVYNNVGEDTRGFGKGGGFHVQQRG